jgi:hypothetical protein
LSRTFCTGVAGILAVALLAPSAPAETPAIVKLSVQPATIELVGPTDRHGILVTGQAADGTLHDVTRQATCTSDKPEVIAVSPLGECAAKADGIATITVRLGGQSASVAVRAKNATETKAPSFVNELEPLLTRLGCNQGACHGKGEGQNGFRLSLRGYAPEFDHRWITREYDGRRINRAAPEFSLLVEKPLGLVSHEGGKLMNVGSREHHVFRDWLTGGMPGPDKDDPKIEKLEILPGNRTLKVGDEQQLLVRADFGDGRWRDVTWLTRFDSNDAGMAEVTPFGKVRVLRNGETAIRASFQTLVAVVIITSPFEQAIPAERFAKRNNFVDEHVFNKLAGLRIEPSDLCSDQEFLRRAFLDTIGVLPTAEEVKAFVADTKADKRAKLIDALLDRPEYVDYWALQLSDLLQNRKERDHDVRGTKGVRSFHNWLRKQVAKNRPWDELARDVLTATGSTTERPEIGYYVVTCGEGQPVSSEVVASVAQAFLATRIGCAKCHNHPLERYTQDDYYHFAAFFSQMQMERKDPEKGATVLYAEPRRPNERNRPAGTGQPRTGQFMKPQPLDRSAVNLSSDPRIALATWITDPKNEYFSGAMVNRMCRHFLGAGLVEPVDDLRASNPPSNPELWQALNKEFVSHKFDLKHLMRAILNSRAYQLSSATRPGNAKDTRFYSHYYARRLPAEVLLDGLSQSTNVPDTFPGYPVGMRAVQLPDSSLKSYFLSLFGKSERVTACACERNGEVTMPQLLHLQNGDSILQKIKSPSGRLAGLLKEKKGDTEVAQELFLATLSRSPNAAEQAAVAKALADGAREEVFRDLFWALVNSKEFCFNH